MKGDSRLLHELLGFDREAEVERICGALRHQVHRRLHRKGVVLGLSGGIDSSVCAALAVRAFGPKGVFGLLMPETHSSRESERLGRAVAEKLGIECLLEDITPALEGLGCYRRQEEAIRTAIPAYGPGWRSKIVLPSVVESEAYRFNLLVAVSPEGEEFRCRLTPPTYLALVAATNFKQRVRKTFEYYHADRLAFAVLGTPNLLEYDQGFFVKNGDGAADVKPIAHLYKTQVYALGEYLELPLEIQGRAPTTDTYSLPQSQEEFYFPLPYQPMDCCLLAYNRGIPPEEIAAEMGLLPEQIARVYRDIEAKRRAALYLGEPPLLVEAEEGTPGA